MKAENIYQQAMEYAENAKEWEHSDADYFTMLPKVVIADKDLDCYALGVLVRLYLLAYYGYDWQKLYNYGNKDYINKSLDKLEKNKYIKREGDCITII